MQWLPEYGRALDELRRRARVTQDEVTERSGIPRATLQRIFAGKAVPDSDRYAALLAAIGATDADVRGSRDTAPIVEVPIYDIEVAAGAGRFLSREAVIGTWPFPRDWIAQHFGADPDLAIVRIVGDSQEPELRNGDSLMIDLQRRSGTDGLHVVRLDDALLVKRLQAGAGEIRLRSYNTSYDDIVIPREEADERLVVIGRAVWTGKTL